MKSNFNKSIKLMSSRKTCELVTKRRRYLMTMKFRCLFMFYMFAVLEFFFRSSSSRIHIVLHSFVKLHEFILPLEVPMFCLVGKQTHSNGISLYIIDELPSFNKILKFYVLVMYEYSVILVIQCGCPI